MNELSKSLISALIDGKLLQNIILCSKDQVENKDKEWGWIKLELSPPIYLNVALEDGQ